jgi:hypothetical protein
VLGTKAAQSGKLLNPTGFKVLKRPDGGVVTQRTANPLPRAEISQSSQFRTRLSRTGSRGEICSGANSMKEREDG